MSGKLSREEVARIEIGHTEVSKSLSVFLSVFFLISIFSVPLVQFVLDRDRTTEASLSFERKQEEGKNENYLKRINKNNKIVLKKINSLETSLEDKSFLRKLFLPPLQQILLRFFSQGNEKAISGRSGWLFFRPGVDYLIGPPFLDEEQQRLRVESHEIWERPVHPDPVEAIVDFKEQLAKRGIKLIVMPVPIKVAIEPDMLSSRVSHLGLANRSWSHFVESLDKQGVNLFDPRPLLVEYKAQNGHSFLATDTHWLPGAMQMVARELALYVEQKLPGIKGEMEYTLQQKNISAYGDVAKMLTLPENTELFAAQQVDVNQVVTADNEFWQSDRNSEVLLLGDSFTNIYSFKGLGWGFSGGLAEHLSFRLKRAVDLCARNDSGAYVTREMLAADLGRGRDRLSGKKLVIWQFAERELAFGDWKKIKMTLQEPKESSFFVAEPGEKAQITGVIEAISPSPRPGSVPYRDNIITIHLINLRAQGRELESDQALVYGWGMRDNTLTELASFRSGDEITLTLSSWEEREGEYGGYRRSPLDDEMIELELPNWGIIR